MDLTFAPPSNAQDAPKSSRRDAPGAPFPPLLQFLLGFIGGVTLDALLGGTSSISGTAAIFGVLLTIAGVALFAWGLWTFAAARTGILLQRPASLVVTHGPYRWTRNPMYVGCVLIHAGIALAIDATWALLPLPAVIWLVTRTVIEREERYMRRTFAGAYSAYCARVGRWI
jgi:protein-S-isoprenylcysteine O-methyltransferase Ste14